MKILNELSKGEKTFVLSVNGKYRRPIFFKKIKQAWKKKHETSPYNQGRQQEIKIKAKMGTSMEAFIPEE